MRAFLQPGLALLAAAAFAAEPSTKVAREVRLTGIVQIHGENRALLEITEVSRRHAPAKPIVREGERVGSLEVTKIYERAGRVKIRDGDVETVYGFKDAVVTADGAAPTLNLHGADSLQALEIYQELANRTVLRSPTLPVTQLNLISKAGLTDAAAAQELEKALTAQEMVPVLQPHLDKFTLVVRADETGLLARLPTPPVAAKAEQQKAVPPDEPIAAKSPSARADVANLRLPAGYIKFQDADLLQVLDVYQELCGRTLLQPNALPSRKISFRTQTVMSLPEATHAFDLALHLAGIETALRGDKFVLAVPASYLPALPVIPAPPGIQPDSKEAPLPPRTLQFNSASLDMVLPIYAELLGRTATHIERSVPSVRLSLRNQTALSRNEAAYALDTLAALNNLQFVSSDNQTVSVAVKPVFSTR